MMISLKKKETTPIDYLNKKEIMSTKLGTSGMKI